MSNSTQEAKRVFILGTTKMSNLPWRSLARLGLAGVDRAGSSIRKASAEHRAGIHTKHKRPLLQIKIAGAGARLQAKMLFSPPPPSPGLGRLGIVVCPLPPHAQAVSTASGWGHPLC